MKKMFLFACLLILVANGFTQNKNIAYQDETVRFTVVTDGVIRLEYAPDGKFVDSPSQVAVIRDYPEVKYQVKAGKSIEITTAKMKLKYKKGSGAFSADNLSVVSQKDVNPKFEWKPGMQQQNNLKGTYRTLDGYNGDTYVHGTEHPKMPIEDGLLATDGWTLIDDSQSYLFDDSDWAWVKERENTDNQDWYFMAYGHDYKQALKDFTVFAGQVPLPPRYAFGYWWSRYWSYSDKEVRDLVRKLGQYDIPLDVLVIDMDWHYTEKGKGAWTGWTWNKKLFPDYPRLLADLDAKGIRTTLNLHPAGGVEPFEEKYDELAAYMELDTTGRKMIPWESSNKSFMSGMFDVILRPMEKNGIDFWWLDWQQKLNDNRLGNLSNTWWINYCFFSNFERTRETRPMLYHRWGGLGNHRYQIGFSGDAVISWQSLDFQPYFNATASNVLYGFWSHDIGGHWGNPIEPELYTRWMQFGALSPILRTHSTKDASITKEPWVLPSEYTDIVRNTIHQRREMIPYIYTMARKAHDEGLSLCRPLYYEWPDCQEAYSFRSEYMFGDQMLVAPITVPMENGFAEIDVWLPEGNWIEVCTGTLLEGNRTVRRSFMIDEYPLYVKAGSIIPLYADYNQDLDAAEKKYVLEVYPGADGSFRFYDDDGDDKNYDKQFATIEITSERIENVQSVSVAPRKGSFEGMSEKRDMTVKLVASDIPEKVYYNDKEIAWQYDGNAFALVVDLPTGAWENAGNLRVVYPQGETLDLLDGIKGNARRLAKAILGLKCRRADIVLKDELGLFGSIGEKVTYDPQSLRESVEQFRIYYDNMEQSLDNQGLSEDDKAWFKGQVR
ncbi:MAG: glycoside hydrolase family 31 protein [Bacteroidales bacterium]|nr:glycoside hydrolase family 31 protein [Bacteroidales bacterium]